MSEDSWDTPLPSKPKPIPLEEPRDDFGRWLLEPLLSPKPQVHYGDLAALRKHLYQKKERIYGRAEFVPKDGWVAEIQGEGADRIILLPEQLLLEVFKEADKDGDPARAMSERIQSWGEAGWLVKPPTDHHLLDVRIAIRLAVLANGFAVE